MTGGILLPSKIAPCGGSASGARPQGGSYVPTAWRLSAMNSSNYDIAIIGAGIIGLATAMRLTQEHPDRKVVVIEIRSRGSRSTRRAIIRA